MLDANVWSLYFSFLDFCFEFDTGYTGNTIKTHNNVKSRMECRALCQTNDDCKAWTFGETNFIGVCHLKSSDAGRQSLGGLISGPKVCQRCDIAGICMVSL